MRARKKKKKNLKQSRMYYAIVILAVAFLILVIKLMYLQITDSTDQYSRQVDQLVEEVPLKASRGNIYDRNMRILVQDSSATAIHVIPLEVKEPEKLAKGLSEKLRATARRSSLESLRVSAFWMAPSTRCPMRSRIPIQPPRYW